MKSLVPRKAYRYVHREESQQLEEDVEPAKTFTARSNSVRPIEKKVRV